MHDRQDRVPRSIPDAGDAGQQFPILLQVRVAVDVVIDRMIQAFDLFAQERDRFGDGSLDQHGWITELRLLLAIEFALQILGQRVAPSQQGP
ncbi:hypothetical protein LMG26686_05543 [Achromobacter mucicolens]|nr:hypothetical protein LMG26686_05543 [Achromobacter mucicolens]